MARVRSEPGFLESLNRAPVYVQLAVQRDLADILARGRARVSDDRLRARVIGNWYLYFRFPKAEETGRYPADAYLLMSVEEDG